MGKLLERRMLAALVIYTWIYFPPYVYLYDLQWCNMPLFASRNRKKDPIIKIRIYQHHKPGRQHTPPNLDLNHQQQHHHSSAHHRYHQDHGHLKPEPHPHHHSRLPRHHYTEQYPTCEVQPSRQIKHRAMKALVDEVPSWFKTKSGPADRRAHETHLSMVEDLRREERRRRM